MNRSGTQPRVLMVASFPPPLTGQTMATQAFAGWAEEVAEVRRLNLADPLRHQRPSGRFSWSQLRRVADVRSEIVHSTNGLLDDGHRSTTADEARWDVGYLTLASSGLGSIRDLLLLRALRPRVDELVVHIHQGSFAGAMSGPFRAPSRQALLGRVDRFLFIAGTLAAQASWVPAARRRIVPNPSGDGTRFTDEEVEAARKRRRTTGPFRILFLANPLPEKGHERLLQALPLLRERLDAGAPEAAGREIRVDVVGAWPSDAVRAEYTRRATGMAHRCEVEVHGAVSDRSRIRALLASAHVLAFPSTYREEGAPLAVIEALGAGTPVLATRHGALPEMVEDGRSGLILDPVDPPALAAGLATLADRTAWPAFSRAARARYRERFAPDAVRTAFLDALLDPRPRGRP